MALHRRLVLPAWAGPLNPPLLACLACRHYRQLALRAAAAQADCAGGARAHAVSSALLHSAHAWAGQLLQMGVLHSTCSGFGRMQPFAP